MHSSHLHPRVCTVNTGCVPSLTAHHCVEEEALLRSLLRTPRGLAPEYCRKRPWRRADILRESQAGREWEGDVWSSPYKELPVTGMNLLHVGHLVVEVPRELMGCSFIGSSLRKASSLPEFLPLDFRANRSCETLVFPRSSRKLLSC